MDELSLDLETDDEEEDRHEPVVDPVLEVFGQNEATVTEADGHLGVPQIPIRGAPRRVGPDQGHHRGDQHHHPTGRFGFQELTHDSWNATPGHGRCGGSGIRGPSGAFGSRGWSWIGSLAADRQIADQASRHTTTEMVGSVQEAVDLRSRAQPDEAQGPRDPTNETRVPGSCRPGCPSI